MTVSRSFPEALEGENKWLKRMVGIVLAVSLVVYLLMSAVPARASEEYCEGDLLYTIENDSITITFYFGEDTVVTVPSEIAGTPVNTIATGAFYDVGVTEVHLPVTITMVQEDAFSEDVKVIYDYKKKHKAGDVNDSGTVNIVDAQIIFDMANGVYTDASPYDLLLAQLNNWTYTDLVDVADVNDDGYVDAVDAWVVQKSLYETA